MWLYQQYFTVHTSHNTPCYIGLDLCATSEVRRSDYFAMDAVQSDHAWYLTRSRKLKISKRWRAQIWAQLTNLCAKIHFETQPGAKRRVEHAGATVLTSSPIRHRNRRLLAIQHPGTVFLRSWWHSPAPLTTAQQSLCTTQKLFRLRTDKVVVLWMQRCVLGSIFIAGQKEARFPGYTLKQNKT